MANEHTLDCIIGIGNRSLEILEPETGFVSWARLMALFKRLLTKACDHGIDDPRKVFHCLKVGAALTIVSLFYYIRVLYDGFGGNALWALMTVVVVFEYTVGGTLYKSLNRIGATTLAGFLALGAHWVASQAGHRFEPVIMEISLFVIALVTTLSRFIPVVKARYDYGCTIFVLTYGLVLVSGYRVEKLMGVAMQRLSTIMIGTCMCIIISILVCPIWAGIELHLLIACNMDKLANSLESCVAEYFSHGDEESKKRLQDYRFVLSSKAYEESMAEFARWEPAHGRFGFKHPWKNYIKVGSSLRSCAYCIETLFSCLDSRHQVPETIRNHLRASCLSLSSSSSNVIRVLSTTVSSMTRSNQMDNVIKGMKDAVQESQNNLKTLSGILIHSHEEQVMKYELQDIIPLVTSVSLLIEISSRIEGIVKAVEELAHSAEFEQSEDEMDPPMAHVGSKIVGKEENMIALQRV